MPFTGAAVLTCTAAIRSGAGLVTLGIPRSVSSAVIKIKPLEVMLRPLSETKSGALSISAYKPIQEFLKQADIVVIGPGLSQDKSTQGLVRRLVKTVDKAMVIDADGLNALAGHLDLLRNTRITQRRNTIITPHPGEMARMLGVGVGEVQRNREKISSRFARDYKVTVALKGRNTVVADYKGNLYINKTGNPGMASGGTGDVLTGIIAAFLGQGLDEFSAVKYAVYIHGLAADLAVKEKTQVSLIASDIIGKIPAAIKRCS